MSRRPVDGGGAPGESLVVSIGVSRQLVAYAGALLATGLCGCSSKSPCQNPRGDGCAGTHLYADEDPRSVCYVCCEANTSASDAWTELSQTDVTSGRFSAYAAQNHPFPGDAAFSGIGATWNGRYFSFDGQTSGLQYHLFTRGRSDEGDLHLYFLVPGDGPISAAPLNCKIARN